MKHTNTPQRALQVEFSTGRVLNYEGKIVIRRDGAVKTESDINHPDRTISCGRGDSQEEQVRQRYPLAQIKYYENTELALEAVNSGEVDLTLGDQAVPNFLKLHPECTVLRDKTGMPIITSVDYSHPAVKPGDQRFLNWVNNWMDFHTVQGTVERFKEQAYREFEGKFDQFFEKS